MWGDGQYIFYMCRWGRWGRDGQYLCNRCGATLGRCLYICSGIGLYAHHNIVSAKLNFVWGFKCARLPEIEFAAMMVCYIIYVRFIDVEKVHIEKMSCGLVWKWSGFIESAVHGAVNEPINVLLIDWSVQNIPTLTIIYWFLL